MMMTTLFRMAMPMALNTVAMMVMAMMVMGMMVMARGKVVEAMRV